MIDFDIDRENPLKNMHFIPWKYDMVKTWCVVHVCSCQDYQILSSACYVK